MCKDLYRQLNFHKTNERANKWGRDEPEQVESRFTKDIEYEEQEEGLGELRGRKLG